MAARAPWKRARLRLYVKLIALLALGAAIALVLSRAFRLPDDPSRQLEDFLCQREEDKLRRGLPLEERFPEPPERQEPGRP